MFQRIFGLALIMALLALFSCSPRPPQSSEIISPIPPRATETYTPLRFQPTKTPSPPSTHPPVAKPAVVAAPSRESIQIEITDVSCPSTITSVKFRVDANSNWMTDFYALPPPGASLQEISLSDENGREYAVQSSGGIARGIDPVTGNLVFDTYATFDRDACDADQLILEAKLQLHGLPADTHFFIDLSDREFGEEWKPGVSIEFFGIPVPIDRFKLSSISEIEDGLPVERPALEVHVQPFEEGGLQLGCLYLTWPASGLEEAFSGCSSSETMIVVTFVGGPITDLFEGTRPSLDEIEFKVTASFIVIDPWILHWSQP